MRPQRRTMARAFTLLLLAATAAAAAPIQRDVGTWLQSSVDDPPQPTPAARATASRWTPIASFGKVPDVDGLPAGTARSVDMAVDGDAVYLSFQDGAKGWKATVFKLGSKGVFEPVAGTPAFTPG